jgi:hypothetical protein
MERTLAGRLNSPRSHFSSNLRLTAESSGLRSVDTSLSTIMVEFNLAEAERLPTASHVSRAHLLAAAQMPNGFTDLSAEHQWLRPLSIPPGMTCARHKRWSRIERRRRPGR